MITSYQWYANGVAIPGATQRDFTFSLRHMGADLTCQVTTTDANGSRRHLERMPAATQRVYAALTAAGLNIPGLHVACRYDRARKEVEVRVNQYGNNAYCETVPYKSKCRFPDQALINRILVML